MENNAHVDDEELLGLRVAFVLRPEGGPCVWRPLDPSCVCNIPCAAIFPLEGQLLFGTVTRCVGDLVTVLAEPTRVDGARLVTLDSDDVYLAPASSGLPLIDIGRSHVLGRNGGAFERYFSPARDRIIR